MDIRKKQALTRIFNYFETHEEESLASYEDGLRRSLKSFRMSDFSKAPYPSQLLTDKFHKKLEEHIIEVHRSSKFTIGTTATSKDLQQLIEYARLSEDDYSDSKLEKLAKLLSIKKDQVFSSFGPSHELVQYMALNNINSIFGREFLLWTRTSEDIVFAGHPDFFGFRIVGNKIQIIDYKPNLHFDLGSDNPADHVMTSIPQVAGYGILSDIMFAFKAAGFTIECITFNKYKYIIYEPYEALQLSIDFYVKYARENPDWAKLLDWGLLQ